MIHVFSCARSRVAKGTCAQSVREERTRQDPASPFLTDHFLSETLSKREVTPSLAVMVPTDTKKRIKTKSAFFTRSDQISFEGSPFSTFPYLTSVNSFVGNVSARGMACGGQGGVLSLFSPPGIETTGTSRLDQDRA